MIARLDPLSKLAMSLVWVIALSFCNRPVTFAIFAVALLALLLAVERVSVTTLMRALAPFAFFAVTSSWIYAVAPDKTYDMARATGWAAAAIVGARTMTVGLVTILFAMTTEPADLARALVARARLSPRFVYGALAAIQFLPGLIEEARLARMTARAAMAHEAGARFIGRARLFFAGLSPGLALVLLAGAVRRAGAAAIAMELRGLGATAARPTWRTPRFTARDGIFCVVASLLLAGAWAAG
ncbi:MAG: hypothetical protein BGP06_00495 [Rhizobiales bacterium 65-9]|nr:hypothetical protein [Hyphomicrobiales bacterium]OJY37251.1 MAG: hypothetical protein BGP06_00495 [Rhizobiales bacterium 65-9]